MKFKFRLQKSLEYTAMKEKRKQADVVRSMRERDQAQKVAKELEAELENYSTVHAMQGLDKWGPFLNGTDAWLDKLRRAQRELEVASERLAFERSELDKILAKRRAMERVREEKHKEFKVQQSRHQQKAMDDLNRLLKDLAE